jgi:hypothetical protein
MEQNVRRARRSPMAAAAARDRTGSVNSPGSPFAFPALQPIELRFLL